MDEYSIKTSQRVSRSCVECGRRKTKCDKKIPCGPCVRRGVAHECKRPITRVRGQLMVATTDELDAETQGDRDDLIRQRSALQARIAELETALALSAPYGHSHVSGTADFTQASPLDDIIPAFEQFDLGLKQDLGELIGSEKRIMDQLYAPSVDPLLLLLPTPEVSEPIVRYSLGTLGWLHCAVNADEFMKEHEDFWSGIQQYDGLEAQNRPWVAVYLALLAVGIIFLDPNNMPAASHLPQVGEQSDDPMTLAVHTSRIWYEASLKEIERHACSGVPSLPIIQALTILTLCHSNFGERQREWLFTGLAANIARCLEMHKLGNEVTCSEEIRQQPRWNTPTKREVGRRLWWACVIRDWLGSWSRSPSISPASFDCQFSTDTRLNDNVLPEAVRGGIYSGPTRPPVPSPVHYHSIMSRLSYVFYIYIKANTHHTATKFTKAIEEIQKIRQDLPLHLSPAFPSTLDDVNWESEHPWVPFQRYLISHVLDFAQLSIARVLATKETGDDTEKYRSMAITSAHNILQRYNTPIPRIYRLVWTTSASTVAAAIFVSLDILVNWQMYRGEKKRDIIALLRHTAVELRKHAAAAVHAQKGSVMIECLLPLLIQDQTTTSDTPRSLKDLLRRLSTISGGAVTTPSDYAAPGTAAGIPQNFGLESFDDNSIFLTENNDYLSEVVGMEDWDNFMANFD